MWRSLLLYLSQNSVIRRSFEGRALARRVALRFVAGEELADALTIAGELNHQGAQVEIDYLGENVTVPGGARVAERVYQSAIERIAEVGARAQLSLKLTQIGLDVDPALCRQILEGVVSRAAERGNFVWIDMEGSSYTNRTLQIYRELRGRFPNMGVAIQAYLRRSRSDIVDLLSLGGTVRLCKGAYLESPRLAFPDKADVDRSFVVISGLLLSSRRPQAFATHDERMIEQVKRMARDNGVDRQSFEFQMLYGVRRDLQQQLIRDGYLVRVYVPYGSEWYPYYVRRLAERPANLLFLVSSVLKETRCSS